MINFLTTICDDCPARVIWGNTGKSMMPVNADPDPAGNIVLIRQQVGPPRIFVTEDRTAYPAEPRWTSHFTNCPQADARRRPRVKPVPQDESLF